MNAPALLAMALAQGAAPACHVMAGPVAIGEVIDAANTMPASCADTADDRKLRYDPQTRAVRAQVAMAAGEPIGRIFLPTRPAVLAGDRIAFAVRIGPVTVTREAVALQRAEPDQRFFVRTDDGEIFAAPPLVAAGRR